MKVRFRAATTVLSATALMGAVLVGVAGPAGAAAPPYEPDANALGQIHFYTAGGVEVTSGTLTDDPPAKYAVASTNDPQSANNHATLYGYTPVAGVNPLNWSGEAMSGSTVFPVADPTAPAVVKTPHRPVVTLASEANGGLTFADYIADFPNGNAAGTGYENLYQLRIKTQGNDPKYWAADIQVSGSAWTVVYPSAVDASTMTISASTTINYGASTTTSTTLKDSVTNVAIGSAAVKLYQRPNTSAPWAFLANATTNASGVASKLVTPTGTTLYQWRYAAAGSHGAATSPTQTVSVKQVVSAHSTKSSVAHNVAFKIYGTVKPASAGQQITLQRKAGTAWNNVTSVTIKNQQLPNGTTTVGFVFTVKQGSAGTYNYRVSKAATARLLAGTSSTLTVHVT
jgi:hypothetical protein